MPRVSKTILGTFSFSPIHCQISIQIEFQIENKKIPEGFYHIFEGMLKSSATINPLERKVHEERKQNIV